MEKGEVSNTFYGVLAGLISVTNATGSTSTQLSRARMGVVNLAACSERRYSNFLSVPDLFSVCVQEENEVQWRFYCHSAAFISRYCSSVLTCHSFPFLPSCRACLLSDSKF